MKKGRKDEGNLRGENVEKGYREKGTCIKRERERRRESGPIKYNYKQQKR